MCGIAGYIGKSRIEEPRVDKTLALMRNRGPDHQAGAHFSWHDTHVGLFHSRLGIIDLEERSNQPFRIGDCTLVFNGEIYNYIELRRELTKNGISLRTESDTEVLLHYYLLHGEQCVSHFEGMWSFAIFDERQGKLFLSRDRFAEKPLYYFKTADAFFFGSEVKFIASMTGQRLPVNQRQVLRYLVNGYKSLYKTEDTFFEGVRELGYGTNLLIDMDLNRRSYAYWTPAHAPGDLSLSESIEGARSLFLDSLKIRLRADVPLAFCLSGGVDSSAIASAATKEFGCDITTFSIIDDDPRYDESENIRAIVDDLGCRHFEIRVSTEADFLDRVTKLVAYHDAPLATISYYVHSFLSEAIAMRGFRVSFSGTGADEIFTGYYDHFNLHLHEMRGQEEYDQSLAAWEKHIRPVVRNPYLRDPELYANNPDFRAHVYLNNDLFAECLKVNFHEPFAEERFCDSLLRNRMMNEMFREGTRVILHEDDLNSMMVSVENRSPYLDSRLFEFCNSIPPKHLIRDGYGKYVLRQAAQGFLNDKVRLDRTKRGFNASLNSAIDLNRPETREYILSSSPIYDLLDRRKIEPLLSLNPLPNSFSKFLFNVINTKIFLELNHHGWN